MSDALFSNYFEDLFNMDEAAQETKVGSESAPDFSQNLEWWNETPDQSKGEPISETVQANFRYTYVQCSGDRGQTGRVRVDVRARFWG